MVFINTDAATSFLTLYGLLSPARHFLICNPCPPGGGGEYKSTVHVHLKVWHCKMCIFVVLCVDETLFYMREYSDARKLPKSYPSPPPPPPPPLKTDAATSLLTLYWILSPARNYLICNPCPPMVVGLM
jgi:hypothetical protein